MNCFFGCFGYLFSCQIYKDKPEVIVESPTEGTVDHILKSADKLCSMDMDPISPQSLQEDLQSTLDPLSSSIINESTEYNCTQSESLVEESEGVLIDANDNAILSYIG